MSTAEYEGKAESKDTSVNDVPRPEPGAGASALEQSLRPPLLR